MKRLAEARRREKDQTRYYRSLASLAEEGGMPLESERLNGLHADEQHHLSRLTARILELGGDPEELPGGLLEGASLGGWEEEARERESGEVAFYQELLAEDSLDGDSREMVEEILASERQHLEHLGGKWMSA